MPVTPAPASLPTIPRDREFGICPDCGGTKQALLELAESYDRLPQRDTDLDC
jgi:hypothetical protein